MCILGSVWAIAELGGLLSLLWEKKNLSKAILKNSLLGVWKLCWGYCFLAGTFCVTDVIQMSAGVTRASEVWRLPLSHNHRKPRVLPEKPAFPGSVFSCCFLAWVPVHWTLALTYLSGPTLHSHSPLPPHVILAHYPIAHRSPTKCGRSSNTLLFWWF